MLSFDNFFLFYTFFSISILISGLGVIISENPVHSVLFLVLVFCSASGLLIILEIDFLAILFLVVYVGAIAVLFVFIVIMLNIKVYQIREELFRFLPISRFILLIFVRDLVLFLQRSFLTYKRYFYWFIIRFKKNTDFFNWIRNVDNFSNLHCFGRLLYTYYAYYFLVAGLILLVALLGAVSLTLQKHRQIKRQQLYQQLSRRFEYAIFRVK